MGQLPYIDYVAEESVPEVMQTLEKAGVSLRHARGTIHDAPWGQEWDCRWRRANRWLSFVADEKSPGYSFVCIERERWSWWFLHRAEHRYLDDAIDAAVQPHVIRPPGGFT